MDIVIWIIVILVYSTIFALACSHLAIEKGKDPSTWAVIGFFLGIVGLIIIGLSEKEAGKVTDGYKKCEKCAETVLIDAKICRYCGFEFPALSISNEDTQSFGFAELPTSSICIPWSNGTYEGEVERGKPQGLGIWESNDGNRYIGYWHNGKMHGRGQLTFSDGKVINDVWLDGKRQYRQLSG